MQVLYATNNQLKLHQAQTTCGRYDIDVQQAELDVHEIQGEDSELIARDKAQKAFAHIGQPVVISDDSWITPGLNGFPGAYMKSVNLWFTPEDWLNLTRSLKDRRIILRQIVVFQDETTQKLFSFDIEGILLKEARGGSPHPHDCITSFDGGKHSNAEYHERGEMPATLRRRVWDDFAEWYNKRHDR